MIYKNPTEIKFHWCPIDVYGTSSKNGQNHHTLFRDAKHSFVRKEEIIRNGQIVEQRFFIPGSPYETNKEMTIAKHVFDILLAREAERESQKVLF